MTLIGLVILSFIFLADWLYSGRRHRWALAAAVGSLVVLAVIVVVLVVSQREFAKYL
jgi:hypothetical protein